MKYLSVCSGVEAATLAWHPLGWEPVAFAEIDAFPSAVLAHRWPDVPNLGDFTRIGVDDVPAIDLLVGGTPCQDFSVAGLREGLDGERGALTLEFLRLAGRLRPRWVVWENVPGVMSSDGGRALGAFLGGLAELGYGFAWRVLDAQYFGVAQRRRRQFVVAHAGGLWQRAAAVLLERACLSGDPAPSREAGENVAGPVACGSGSRGHRVDGETDGALVPVDTLRSHPRPGSNTAGSIVPVAGTLPATDGTATMQMARGGTLAAVAFHARQDPDSGPVTHPLDTDGYSIGVHHDWRARRLTPLEWERLQGMPENHTRIPWRGKPASECPDGPRYKAIGNSMAVPVMRWIGERIELVEDLVCEEAA